MSNIITFFGADYKVGVTMITQCIAEILATYLLKRGNNEKLLLLHFDGKNGFDYTEQNAGSIDTIRAAIMSKTLTPEEFEQSCYQKENLYMLKGTDDILERKTAYRPEFVKNLLEILSTNFNYILIDGGSSIDLPLSIGSLQNVEKKVLITTQQKSAYESHSIKDEQVLYPLGITFQNLIINKFAFTTGKFLETENTLMKQYGMDGKAFVIPLLDYAWQAEYEKTSLVNYKNKAFNNSILNIVENLYFPEGEPKKGRAFFRK